jgi:DNA gyrase inhibitor GyrI
MCDELVHMVLKILKRWRSLKKWAKEKNLLKSAILLAIPQDNPDKTLPENCRFDDCIVISKDYQIDNKPIQNWFHMPFYMENKR